MARKIVSIDIGATHERIVEMRGNRVERWSIGTPALDEGGSQAPVGDIGQRIKRLMRSSGISGGDLVVSLDGLYSVARVVSLPNVTPGEALNALPQIATDMFPMDQTSVQWQVVDSDEEGQLALIVGVPNSSVSDVVSSLRTSGIRPSALELRFMALSRVVNSERALIINGDGATSDVVVVSGGIPHIMRTVARPREQSAEELAAHLSVMLHHAVVFYNQNNPERPMGPSTPLYLTGAISEDPELVERLSGEVEFPLAELAPPLEYPAYLPVGSLAVALGLALRQAKSGRGSDSTARPLTINFQPRSVGLVQLARERIMHVMLVLAGVALAMLMYGQVADVNLEQESLQSHMVSLQAQLNIRQAELERLKKMEQEIAAVEGLTADRGKIIEVVRAVQAAVGPEVLVRGFEIKKSQVLLSLGAATISEAIEHVETLRAAGWTVPFTKPSNNITATIDRSKLLAE